MDLQPQQQMGPSSASRNRSQSLAKQTNKQTNKSKAPAPFSSSKSQVPKGRVVTCANFVCDICPQKTETHRVQMTASGNKLDCPGDASSPTVSVLAAKAHVNSTVSNAKHGVRHMGVDIKNYHLGAPMEHCQHMRVPTSCIPQEVWDDPSCDIHIADKWLCMSRKPSRTLRPQGSRHPVVQPARQEVSSTRTQRMPCTPGHWRHRTKCTTFVLCVDDFGVKCFSKADAQHLTDALEADYKLTIDWDGALCCGLTLD
jgi:hypothetical protein